MGHDFTDGGKGGGKGVFQEMLEGGFEGGGVSNDSDGERGCVRVCVGKGIVVGESVSVWGRGW